MVTTHILDFKQGLIDRVKTNDQIDGVIELLRQIDKSISNRYDINNCLITIGRTNDEEMTKHIDIIAESITMGVGKVNNDNTVTIGHETFKVFTVNDMNYVIMNNKK